MDEKSNRASIKKVDRKTENVKKDVYQLSLPLLLSRNPSPHQKVHEKNGNHVFSDIPEDLK